MSMLVLSSLPLVARHCLDPILRTAAYGTGIFTVLFCAASVWGARRLWSKPPKTLPPSGLLPPVTILKPIKGLDREMHENIASFLAQDYPKTQIIFCLQNPEDPALAVLKKLREEFPEADMEIVISSNRIGYNPKINNLSNAAPFIKHEFLLISDSDVRVGADFLRRAVPVFRDPGVGLVTCFYRSSRAQSLGAAFEALSINAQFLPQAAVAAGIGGMRFAMGAVMLVRRETFEAAGGFSNLSKHLADDYCLGLAVRGLGLKIALADPIVTSVPDAWSLKEHLGHLIRWSRTIRVCHPAGYFASVLLQGFAFLCLDALWSGPTRTSLALMSAVIFARMASVAWIHLVYLRNREILQHLLLVPLSDLIQFIAWVCGFRSRKVIWRGEAYYIQTSGRLVPVNRGPALPAVAAG